MTIYSGWDVRIGGFDGSTTVTNNIPADAIDFTSRVLSLKVDNQAYLGKVGRTTTQVVLDNSDGALTPEGGGTYASTDWFAEPLHIQARLGTSEPPAIIGSPSNYLEGPYFSGPINDFNFVDDGYTSTVTLTAVDWLTFFARFTMQSAETINDKIDNVFYELTNDFKTTSAPLYGAGSALITWWLPDIGTAEADALIDDLSVTVAKGDYLGDAADTLIASDGGTILPAQMAWLSPSQIGYIGYVIPRKYLFSNVATSGTYTTYPLVFNGTTGALGSTELPFKELKLEFNDDEFVTQAEINRTSGTAQYSFNNTGSTTWGPKSVSISGLPLTSDTDSLSYAQWFTNRFNEVNFTPSSLEITGSMIESKCADAALNYVKQILKAPATWYYSALSRPLQIKWTGAGGTSNTKNVLANRVTLTATPTDWKIKLGTVDGVTNGAFILDSTIQGVLDTNKVG